MRAHERAIMQGTVSRIYNKLQLNYDPAQGEIDRLTQEKRKSELQTEIYTQKTAEAKARQDYLDSLKGEGGAAPAPAQPEPGAGVQEPEPGQGEVPSKINEVPPGNGTESDLPDVENQFGKDMDYPALQDPSKAQETKAAPGFTDLFHDRRARRSAVRAAIRETELDDAHDLAGSEFYELTMHLTLVPGESNV